MDICELLLDTGKQFKFDKLVAIRTNIEQVPPALEYFVKIGGICFI